MAGELTEYEPGSSAQEILLRETFYSSIHSVIQGIKNCFLGRVHII